MAHFFVQRKYNSFSSGFSLIEMVFVVFIMAVILIAFYNIFILGMQYSSNAKSRLGAVSLANQQIEYLRNVAYTDLGVQGGVPNGSIDPDEYMNVNGTRYRVLTDVRYIDDSSDGTLGGSPNDVIPNDYKRVRVTVKWGKETQQEQVYLLSDFIPVGLEQSAGGGILSVNAIESSGSGIQAANVYIENDGTGVNIHTMTDSTGNVSIVGVPAAALNTYEITVSKNGFETVSTMSPYPETAYHPADVHASVAEGGLTRKDIIINELADLHLTSKNMFGEIVGDINFTLSGGRILGLEDGTGTPVYSYDQNISFGSDGELRLQDLSPGTYSLSIHGSSGNQYLLYKSSPGIYSQSNAFALSAGADQDIDIFLADKNIPSLIVTVRDSSELNIQGVSVHLQNSTLGYDETLVTDMYGKVYFPTTVSIPLQNGQNYDLSVDGSSVGYDSKSSNITVNNLTERDIQLSAL